MSQSSAAPTQPQEDQHLQRTLSNRHIQLIAIGGAIGTGLFMGSGKTISVAGPSILLVYTIIGVVMFFVMRAMGELLLHNLSYKSFQDFAADMLGPWAGFFAGWTYWLCWVVTGMADIIAVAGYFNFWVNPSAPTIIKPLSIALAIGVLLTLLGLNLLTVKLFGELEFWFALIKIVAIIALILLGIYLVLSRFTSPDGTVASINHLWDHGGFFPKGFTGLLAGFQIAIFAFAGVELVGTTAAETQNPFKSLPKAINAIPVRIVIFYVLAMVVIMTVTPWDKIDPAQSPFVVLFSSVGLAAAAGIMNFVVLTSASSSANSGIFSTSRMLYGLSHKGMAPKAFGELSKAKVPHKGLFVSVALVSSSIVLMLSESIMGAFTVVTTISAVLFIFVWSMILISYLAYRHKYPTAHAKSAFPMPGDRIMAWVSLVFFVFVICVLTLEKDTLQALLVTPIWFVLLTVAWFLVRGRVHNDDSGTDAVAK
ncbi:MAG: amino acid permease [Propionibacteriaceae bacterium]